MAFAADPKSVKVNLSMGTGVDIEWKDGHVSHYPFVFLRDACPCAFVTMSALSLDASRDRKRKASLESFPCLRRLPDRRPPKALVSTRLSFTGMTGTISGFIPGSFCVMFVRVGV